MLSKSFWQMFIIARPARMIVLTPGPGDTLRKIQDINAAPELVGYTLESMQRG